MPKTATQNAPSTRITHKISLTIIAVGVAKPKLHGHATRHTSTARRTPNAHAPPLWPLPITPAKASGAALAEVGVALRSDGERTPQNRSVEADAAKTSHVNFPAIASASRCTGALRACVEAPTDQLPTLRERARVGGGGTRHPGISTTYLCRLLLRAARDIASPGPAKQRDVLHIKYRKEMIPAQHLGWWTIVDAHYHTDAHCDSGAEPGTISHVGGLLLIAR